jgi:inner membrane protein
LTTLYTHAVVGLGIARLCAARPKPWTYWGLATLLPLLPDFDVFSTAAYGAPLGHRGITHSLAFAMVVSVFVATATFRYFRTNWWLLAGTFFAIIASHGLLDAMTRGGADIPFFWPLDVRYGNWGPIPVADMGLELPDPRYHRAWRSELLWIWLPTVLLVGLVTVYRHRKQSARVRDSVG